MPHIAGFRRLYSSIGYRPFLEVFFFDTTPVEHVRGIRALEDAKPLEPRADVDTWRSEVEDWRPRWRPRKRPVAEGIQWAQPHRRSVRRTLSVMCGRQRYFLPFTPVSPSWPGPESGKGHHVERTLAAALRPPRSVARICETSRTVHSLSDPRLSACAAKRTVDLHRHRCKLTA